MPASSQIGPYHNYTASAMGKILNTSIKIGSETIEWTKVKRGSKIRFELFPNEGIKPVIALIQSHEDSSIHRVHVFPLNVIPKKCVGTFWVSWHELWSKEDDKNYNLLDAGWTLFEGVPENENITPILRVDWDQFPRKGSEHAGHPHWHVERDISMSNEQAKIKQGSDLIEVSMNGAYTNRPISLGFIHLAMGAWNAKQEHPKCWQRNYEDDCKQLSDWCIKTLKYLNEQICGA